MLPTIWAEKRCRDGNSWPQADGTRAIRTRTSSSIRGLMTPMASTARTSRDVRDVRLQRFMLKWEGQQRARSAASWPMMTDAVDVGGEIHARREATRVHPIADGVAAAGPRGARAAIPTRLPRSGCSHASWAADRRPRGNNSVRQLAIVGSRGPYPPMLVGVSGSDVHDHQIRQIDHATALGRQRLSPSTAPMPAGILGGLWRVPLLGVGVMAAMAASGATWTGAHAGLGR